VSDFIASVHCKSRGEKWSQDLRLGKHTIVSDEPEPHGKDVGPAPYALVLAGLAACTSMTLEMYAERKGWKLGEVKVDLRMFRDGEGEAMVERIERKIAVAEPLSEEQRVRLAEIAAKTPVTKTLKRAYVIETEIVTGK
jgi:putative redox protein